MDTDNDFQNDRLQFESKWSQEVPFDTIDNDLPPMLPHKPQSHDYNAIPEENATQPPPLPPRS